MLTRPPTSLSHIIPVIAMINPSPSSFSTPPNNLVNSFLFDMECNLPFDQLRPELLILVTIDTLHIQAYPFLLKYQTRILRKYGDTSIELIGIHPKYPFIHPFYFPTQHWLTFPKETLCFLWYLCHHYYIAIEFPFHALLKIFQLFQDNYRKPRSFPLDPSHTNLKHFLLWFRPIPIWFHWLKTYQKHTKPKPNQIGRAHV